MARERKRDQSEYFAKWYRENAGTLNEKRRAKYHNDPEYRKRSLSQSRESKQRHAGEVTGQVRELETRGGDKILLYTIGAAAGELGCSPSLLRKMERLGQIPEPGRYGEGKFRMYTKDQVGLLGKYMLDLEKAGSSYKARAVVHEEWKVHFATRW